MLITSSTAAILTRMHKTASLKSGPFTYWKYHEVEKAIKRAVAAAGIPAITPEDLGRTFICRALRSGMGTRQVLTLAGLEPTDKGTLSRYRREVRSRPDVAAGLSPPLARG